MRSRRMRRAQRWRGWQSRVEQCGKELTGPGRSGEFEEDWSAIRFDGDAASATTVPNALYEGPPESVHGGYLAHLMDCMLGTLVQATGRRSVTGTLDLRYLARTPLDVPLELGARILETTGRKTTAEAWVEVDGARTVEARGLFIELREVPWAAAATS